MFKKILAAAFAVMLLVSMPAMALAAPDDTPTPTGTTAPVDPAAFTAQVKGLVQQVAALKGQLAQERQLDRAIISDIHSLKGIYTPDPAQLKAFRAGMAPLEKELKRLNNRLAAAQKAKKPKPGAITLIQSQIANVQAQIDALNAKYPGLQKQIKANRSARKTLKPFRAQLKAEYAKLTPYFEDSRTMSKEIRTFVSQLTAAIQAGDLDTASGILAKVNADVSKLEGDINQRIAIRDGITKMLDDFKASLAQ